MSKFTVPNSWKWVRLDNLVGISSGGTPSRSRAEYFNGDIFWTTPTDIKSNANFYLQNTKEKITEKGLASSSAKILPKNSILVTSHGTIGAVVITKIPTATNQNIYGLICNNNLVSNEFLARYLAWSKEQLLNISFGTTFEALSSRHFKKFQVPLPTLPEQEAIVKILLQAEKIWELKRKVNNKLNKLPNSIFKQIFGVFSKNNFDTTIKLENVSDVVPGVTKGRKLPVHKTVIVPYLRVANVQDGYLDLSNVKTIEVLFSDVEKYALQEGDIVITEGGDFDKLGRGAIWKYNIPDCIHQNHVFRIRLDSSVILPTFFNYYLQSSFVRQYFLRSAKRTTNLASINISQLKSLPVPIPPMNLQIKFKKAIEHSNKIGISESRDKIDSLVYSLTVQAFTGQLTQSFRQKEQYAISAHAKQRDETLKLKSASDIIFQQEQSVDLSKDIAAYLSTAQKEILENLEAVERYALAESDFTDLNMPPNQVQRNLDLLSAIGLVKSVNIPIAPGEIGNVFYTTAYRSLKEGDDTKEIDLENLEKEATI